MSVEQWEPVVVVGAGPGRVDRRVGAAATGVAGPCWRPNRGAAAPGSRAIGLALPTLLRYEKVLPGLARPSAEPEWR